MKGCDCLTIKEMNIDELTMYENNPRNNDEAVKYVAKSIKEFGFKNPIVIDKNNVIVAGHTRYKASKKLNLDKIPCIVADDLTDKQIKAFRLADNKVSEFAKWDNDLLNLELDELNGLDFEMSDFGFDFTFRNNIEDFVSDLEKNDFSENNPNREFFSMTFLFPKDKEEHIKDYINKNGKDVVANKIINLIEEG